MKKIVIPAKWDHIDWIARNMAQDDVVECAAFGLTPFEALKIGLDNSVLAWTGMVMPDCRPVCIFGVIPMAGLLGGEGMPWFLATEELKKHKLFFLKHCDEYLQKMLALFPYLYEWVHARHVRGIKWLKWLGFKQPEKPEPYGPLGTEFFRFEIRR